MKQEIISLLLLLLGPVLLSHCSTSASSDVSYTLTIFLLGEGGGTVTSSPSGINCSHANPDGCASSFIKGTGIVLTAEQDESSLFSRWSDACSGSNETCEITIDKDLNAEAIFDPVSSDLCTLAVSLLGDGIGTVSSDPSGIECSSGNPDECSFGFSNEQVVILTATPEDGSEFVGWGGDCSGEPCEITMSQDRAVAATFEFLPELPTIGLLDQSSEELSVPLVYDFIIGGPLPSYQYFYVVNTGVDTLVFDVSAPCDWLDVNPYSNSSEGISDEILVVVTVDITDLEADDELYACDIVISSDEASNSPQAVPVFLSVSSTGPPCSDGTTDDVYETNDSCNEPVYLGNPNDTLDNVRACPNNPDFYSITIPDNVYGTILFSVTWSTLTDSNIDLELYDYHCDTPIETSSIDYGYDEYIMFTVYQSDFNNSYDLKVFLNTGDESVDYNLAIGYFKCDDLYEYNNDFSRATDVVAQIGNFNIERVYEADLGICWGDPDYYKVVTEPGVSEETYNAKIIFNNGNPGDFHDLNLYLYDDSYNEIANSISTSSNFEDVYFTSPSGEPAIYYIKVMGYESGNAKSLNKYSLEISKSE